MAAEGLGLQPTALPTGAANFAGIAYWLVPPDCTMAVGTSHVLVSVNSSVSLHQPASLRPPTYPDAGS
jgi:hypothetical protein